MLAYIPYMDPMGTQMVIHDLNESSGAEAYVSRAATVFNELKKPYAPWSQRCAAAVLLASPSQKTDETNGFLKVSDPIYWLVVTGTMEFYGNMNGLWLSIQLGMSSSQLTWTDSYFSEG